MLQLVLPACTTCECSQKSRGEFSCIKHFDHLKIGYFIIVLSLNENLKRRLSLCLLFLAKYFKFEYLTEFVLTDIALRVFPMSNFVYILHGKNGFAEVSKNLAINLKIILSDHQNNYAEHFVDDNTVKSCNILAVNVLHYFDDINKIIFSSVSS